MVIYSGTQRIFQIPKWKAAAKITCIFGLVLKIKKDTETKREGRRAGKKRRKQGGG